MGRVQTMTRAADPSRPGAASARTAIAEFNWGRLRHDWDDPRVAPFVNALESVNAIAMASPGFLWMMDEATMEAAQLDPDGPLGGDPRVASTLSVWASLAELRQFVFEGRHGAFLRRGGEWFEPTARPRLVLWPVAPSARPNVDDGVARLRRLEAEGAGPEAFDWAYAAAHLGGATA